MVIIFVLFGTKNGFEYEAQVLIPYISHGPLVFCCTLPLVSEAAVFLGL